MLVLALAVLLVLTGAGICALSGSRVAAWTTLAAAVAWPFVNRRLEGPVLVVIGHGHGVTLSDLMAPVGVVLAVLVLTGMLGGSSRRRVAGGSALCAVDTPARPADET